MDRARPAAYIRATRGDDGDLARQRAAIADGARQRGWPPPTVYAEEGLDLAGEHAPALARLQAAIEAGRHDALLITDPGAVTGTATHLMGLLFRCTRNGVVVGFLLPPALADSPATATPPAAQDEVPALLAPDDWGVLARARLEALSGLFPDWRIWLDQRGWHARRRPTPYPPVSHAGAPACSVHAGTPTGLAAQLCWQQAADRHAPGGCSAR
jgi:hypothetical protein